MTVAATSVPADALLLTGSLSLVFQIIGDLLWLYFFILIARLVFDYIQLFNPSWRPKGALLVVVELIYTVTDPPLRFFRRFIPPLRIGQVALDLSFLIAIVVLQVLMAIVGMLASQ